LEYSWNIVGNVKIEELKINIMAELKLKSRPSADENYFNALISALSEYQEQRQVVSDLWDELDHAKEKLNQIDSVISPLWESLSESSKQKLEKEIKLVKSNRVPKPESGTDVYRGVVNFLGSRPKKSFSIQDIQEKLNLMGLKPGAKQVGNILGRLAGMGKLERIRRGVYRIPDYGVGIVAQDEEFEVMVKK
jgi:hypothetical protein|tara:strand:- start:5383 stop:5958 length:576 start_codon:yes stop_codon:yes gene_type:complete